MIALVALLYAKSQLKETSLARQQTKDLEMERSQPYVVISIDDAAAHGILDLVIKNYGLTAAHDVRIEIDPWPSRASGNGDEVMMPEVIPFLAPGQEWRTMWDLYHQRVTTGLPDRHEAKLTYRGLGGKQLQTDAILDLGIYRSMMSMVTHGIHDIAKAVLEMNRRQKKWTEFGGGLKVVSRSGDERDARHRERARQHGEADEAQREELKSTLEDSSNRDSQVEQLPLAIGSDQP